MTEPSSPDRSPSESERLQALRRYHILDTPPEEGFDRLTRLAARLLDAPIALITFLDEDRQWFKSCVGLDRQATDREEAFCAHNVHDASVMVVEDATADPRFADNPLVTGDPGIRFYAGAPLVSPGGYVLGSLCVIDTVPRSIGDDDIEALRDLAATVIDELELRREVTLRTQKKQHDDQKQHILRQIARGAPLSDTLRAIIRYIERRQSELLGSVLLYDASEDVVRHGAAPSLPDAYNEAIDGVPVGPAAGSCGTALYRGEPVVVEDIAEDPLWADYRAVALEHDLRACWSAPVQGTNGDLLGTFAFYYHTPRAPTEEDRRLHEEAQHLAQIAIERNRENEVLRAQEQQFRHLFENNPLPMWVYSRETLHFLAVNEAAVDQYGYSEAEFMDMRITDIRPEEDIPRLMDNLAGERPALEHSTGWRHQRKDGSIINVDIISHTITFDDEEAALIVAQDVTERKKAERALREHEKYLSVTLNSIGDAVIATDAVGRITEMNDVAERLTGWTRDTVRGKPLAEIFHIHNARTGEPVESPVEEVLREGKTVGLANHTMLTARDGTERQIADSAAPIRTDDGSLMGVVLVFRDVTEQYERQQALRERTIALEQAQAITRTGYGTIDLQRNTIDMSPEAGHLLGLDASEEQPLEAFMALVHPDDLELVAAEFERVRAGDKHDEEYRITPAGTDTIRWIRGQGYPQTDESGTVTHVFSTIADVTERKEREQALRESQERLELAVTGANLGLWDWNVQTSEVIFNDQWAEMLGYSLDEITPHVDSWAELVHPDDKERVEETLQAHLEGETESYETVHRMKAKDGSWRWILDLGKVVERAEDGTPLRATGIHHDITERKRMEQRLQAQERMYRELVQTTSAILWRGDPETFEFTYVSPQVEDILGYSPEAWTNDPDFWISHIHPEDREWAPAYCARATQEQRRHNFDYRMIDADGNTVWLQDIVNVITEEGEPVELVGVMIDVTDRKRTEEALRRSRDLLAQTQRLAGAWEHNLENDSMLWSDKVYEIHDLPTGTEVSLEEAIGFYTPEGQDIIRKAVERAMDKGMSYDVEAPLVSAEGSKRWVRAVGAPVKRDGKVVKLTGAIQDITDRKLAEHELRDTKQLLEKTLESLAEAVFVVDPSEREIVMCNAAVEDIFGYEKETLLGENTARLYASEEAFERFGTVSEKVLAKEGRFTGEYQMQRKDGSVITTEHLITPLTGTDWTRGVVSVIRDVTERKQYEQELIEAKETAEQMNQLKSAFLANMSHEIRTPLTSIIGFAEVLAEMELGDSAARFANLINRSGERLLNTLNSVLDLSQLESGSMKLRPERVNCSMEVRGVVESFSALAERKGVAITVDTPPEPVRAELDPGAFQRALTNLMSNAIKFTDEGGRIDVALQDADDALTLQVADTGVGIDPEFVPHLFEAFKQESTGSARMFEGTGLGLTITRQLIRLMGGHIEVESAKGEGTVFTIHLPKEPPSDASERAVA